MFFYSINRLRTYVNSQRTICSNRTRNHTARATFFNGASWCGEKLQQDIEQIADQQDAAADDPDKNGDEPGFEHLAQDHHFRQ